jgi:SAM-dependent methyltransferase
MSNYSDSIFTDDPNTPWYKVLNLIADSSKVLDIGCSSGNFDEIIIETKHSVVDGIELNLSDAKVAAKKLRKVLNLNVETDDLNELDKNYDVIYFGDVIEHLVDPVSALKKVKTLLSKNGGVIFSIPNMAHISVRMMLLSGNFEYGNTGLLDKTHLHFYDKNEVQRVFAEAGYEIEVFDWVSRDIPANLLSADLKKIGLKADKSFYEKTKTLDYAAYQFIGIAKPSSKIKKLPSRNKISPRIDMFENHLKDLRESYEKDIERLNNELSSKNSAEMAILKKQVESYEKSLSWKVTKPLRATSKLVRAPKKK